MLKPTRQLEQEFPSLWEVMQETAFPETLWEPINEYEENIGPFVDTMETAALMVAKALHMTKKQAALALIETLFTRLLEE